MKCIYYSRYPYHANDFKKVDAKEYGCDWTGDALDMPFRLYKAVEAEANTFSPKTMVEDLFEALDLPQVDDYHKPFNVFYGHAFIVIPTKHYFGATNESDGVYEIDGQYYVICYDGIAQFSNWESAVRRVAMFENNSRYYLRGIDYTKPE